jgi:hypothetical protein
VSRVLSTETAKQSIVQMQSIINGGLLDAINQLDREGQTLSQPEVWDGQLAAQFRGEVWPSSKSALDQVKVQLEELRLQLDKINVNIMTAGGNA